MPQQISTIPIGGSAAFVAGNLAFFANEKLGNVGFGFQNIGNNAASLQLRELIGSGTNAAYSYNLGPMFTVQPQGYVEQNFVILGQQFALFGSGNTEVSMSIFLFNPADRRNPKIEVIPLGKQNWGNSPGLNVPAYSGNYGPTPLQ